MGLAGLFGLTGRFGVQLSLERISSLLKQLDHPQRGIPVMHVAGTNGKGSVCAMLSQILLAAGYRVGRYTSPHLVSWRERIWINGGWISESEWAAVLGRVAETLRNIPQGQEHPTQFEIVTAAAWLYFRQQRVDCVVLEVGLGGRLDATNADIDPILTLITSIGWDHWQRLGPTLADIAREKAGICKPGIPVITPADQGPEVEAVLLRQAIQMGAPFRPVKSVQKISDREFLWQDHPYPLPLQGDVQLINISLVLAAVEQLRDRGWQITDEAIRIGLQQTHWPGRLQRVTIADHTLLLDGAHNQPAALALRRYLDQYLTPPTTWFMGLLETKDREGILKSLLRPGDRLYTLPIQDHAALDPGELATLAQQIQPQLALVKPLESLQTWQHLLESWPPIPDPRPSAVLCGSLYLIGQVMRDCLGWELAQ
ncbi:MAG: bifunctional folylpolyglutamate synthase/dihydrofolate synthase [Synechococcaceae cyanobacterium SM2_3_1]|nr:bifunctional folylpolyglutamate synthase/dihydrofolate synthase [Synechococcaceae cyanobacterium SM2_3_1]